jgi:triacylglycerol lipase|tara:strand:+ start:2710 stop:3465 length:756 start_codon:yes stop_codon:yes gene_type:complete
MGIRELSFKERSLLFAKLAFISYNNAKQVKSQAKKLGFTTIEFYDRNGAQAYRFQNKTDLVIACRGTQPTEFNDISADLKAMPVIAETVSRVHRGFKAEVDMLWPSIMADLMSKTPKQDLWFCGHSLGAAMATIMASRCHYNTKVPNPQQLYTYGSPRVGWKGYVVHLGVEHHRWKNNNDIVTTVPLRLMGYAHHGTEHYLNAYGKYRKPTGWQMVKDRWRGIWMGWKNGKIDSFSDHSMTEYIKHITQID